MVGGEKEMAGNAADDGEVFFHRTVAVPKQGQKRKHGRVILCSV